LPGSGRTLTVKLIPVAIMQAVPAGVAGESRLKDNPSFCWENATDRILVVAECLHFMESRRRAL
jgi:hypothetical protein